MSKKITVALSSFAAMGALAIPMLGIGPAEEALPKAQANPACSNNIVVFGAVNCQPVNVRPAYHQPNPFPPPQVWRPPVNLPAPLPPPPNCGPWNGCGQPDIVSVNWSWPGPGWHPGMPTPPGKVFFAGSWGGIWVEGVPWGYVPRELPGRGLVAVRA